MEVNMHSGELWHDNTDKPLAAKIEQANNYFHRKYGKTYDLVFVHRTMVDTDLQEIVINGQTFIVKVYNPVLRDHLYIGIGDEAEMKAYKAALHPIAES